VVRRRARASPSQGKIMWSVIIVIKLGTFKNIVLRGKRRTRKEGKAERE